MIPPTVLIRQAVPADTNMIVSLSRSTFWETYARLNTAENMDIHMEEHFHPEKIHSELSNPAYRFYIASLDQTPAGFMKTRPNQPSPGIPGKRSMEIQRIYVLEEFQGASIGKELMKMAKVLAKRDGFQLLWLQVWQKNEKAIHFYQKSGFVIYDTSTFVLGRELQQDYLMRFDLYT